MYTITQNDQPREMQSLLQSDIGAPCPMVIAGEHSLLLAYYCSNVPDDWDGKSIRLLSDHDADEPCALITFERPYVHMFGPPNDEAFFGHPLAKFGLRPYSVFEIENSSWVHALERMNSVHPCHRPEHFADYRHFVFAFHDRTFECIAYGFKVSLEKGSVWTVVSTAQNNAFQME